MVELKSGKISRMVGTGGRISGQSPEAKVGDLLPENTELSTGKATVTEVTFEDGSVMRLGENAKILFLSKERLVQVKQGVALFYSPEGHGGISLQGGEVTGQVSGSTVMGARDSAGNFSFFVLESSGPGAVSGPSVAPVFLGVGQMTTVRSAAGQTPEVMDVHVDAVRDISPIFQEIPTALPSDPKVLGTTEQQAFEVQTDVKLLSSLENYKLTATDPEGVALAMICKVGQDEIGAAKNILLRPMDTAAGTEAGADQGSGVVLGSFSVPVDARQNEAAAMVAASSPASTGGLGATETAAGGDAGGADPSGTDTAAGGGGATDTQTPLSPVLSPIQPAQTTPT